MTVCGACSCRLAGRHCTLPIEHHLQTRVDTVGGARDERVEEKSESWEVGGGAGKRKGKDIMGKIVTQFQFADFEKGMVGSGPRTCFSACVGSGMEDERVRSQLAMLSARQDMTRLRSLFIVSGFGVDDSWSSGTDDVDFSCRRNAQQVRFLTMVAKDAMISSVS